MLLTPREQKIIELILVEGKSIKECREVIEWIGKGKIPSERLRQCMIKAGRKILHYSQKQWIPVKEKLPEDEQLILLFDEGEGIVIGFYRKGGFFAAAYDCNYRLGYTTAWLPLPAPPKEK